MAVLTGVLLGLSTLVFVGPVFFYLLKSSIEDGFKAGISVAIGIILGDIICVLFAVYGLGDVLSSKEYSKWFAGIGGVILLLFGLNYLFSNHVKKITEVKPGLSMLRHGVSGFLINFVNPFVFAVWFGFYALLENKFENNGEVITGLVTTLIVILITDVLKAFFANKLSKIIKTNKLLLFYRIVGGVMVIFSIRLFYELL